MAIEKVCVVGGGTMGRGIVQVCAQMGKFDTRLVDVSQDRINEALESIQHNISTHFVAKGKLSREEGEASIKRIRGFTDLREAACDADYAIEAVNENEELKLKLFKELDNILPSHAIISTNSSVLSITKLASVTQRPDRCIGTHFAAPVPRTKLFEVIRGLFSSEQTFQITTELGERIGKPVLDCRDTPGYISNRLLIPMYNVAAQLVVEGYKPEDVDNGVKNAVGWQIGPLEIMDGAGLDIILAASEAIYKDLGYDPMFRPCPLLRRMVDAGLLGRKTGRGFFQWTDEQRF